MDKNKLMDAVGEIDPAFVEEAKPGRVHYSRIWTGVGAAAAALVLIVGTSIALPKLLGRSRPGDVSAGLPTEPPVMETKGAYCMDPVSTGGPVSGQNDGSELVYGIVDTDDMLIAEPEPREYVRYAETVSSGGETDWAAYRIMERKWNEALAARREAGGSMTPISDFTGTITDELISRSEGDNVVWSPVNVYLALAMLTETCDGETSEQLLALMGARNIGEMRANVRALIESEENYDGVNECSIANSLWLNNGWRFYEDILKTLAKEADASSYWGDPTDPAFTNALRSWLDDNTRGLLKDSVKNVKLDPATVVAIASTVYFKSAWQESFNADITKPETFHAPSGDVTRDFMRKRMDAGDTRYYKGNGFIAVEDKLKSGASAWYLLPDEGVSVEDMLKNEGMAFIMSDKSKAADDVSVLLAAPKMDVSSDMDLVETLKALGVTDCFDASKADFSPLTPDPEGLFVSKISHAARIRTDEDGLEAAAFTLVSVDNYGLIPQNPIEITLDRPYVMAVSGVSEAPLFISVVNDPAK